MHDPFYYCNNGSGWQGGKDVPCEVIVDTAMKENAAIIGFIANEIISIVENAGLMGVPLPKIVYKAIDILTEKGKEK